MSQSPSTTNKMKSKKIPKYNKNEIEKAKCNKCEIKN